CRTVEGGKLLLQRCLAAHGRPGAGVHFGDALMEARDLHFARSKGLFQRNLTRERSAEALPSFGSLGEGGGQSCRFFCLLGHFTLPLRMSRSNWLVDLQHPFLPLLSLRADQLQYRTKVDGISLAICRKRSSYE